MRAYRIALILLLVWATSLCATAGAKRSRAEVMKFKLSTAFEEVRELKKLGIDPLEFAFMVQDVKKLIKTMIVNFDESFERKNVESMSEYVAYIKEIHQVLLKIKA